MKISQYLNELFDEKVPEGFLIDKNGHEIDYVFDSEEGEVKVVFDFDQGQDDVPELYFGVDNDTGETGMGKNPVKLFGQVVAVVEKLTNEFGINKFFLSADKKNSYGDPSSRLSLYNKMMPFLAKKFNFSLRKKDYKNSEEDFKEYVFTRK